MPPRSPRPPMPKGLRLVTYTCLITGMVLGVLAAYSRGGDAQGYLTVQLQNYAIGLLYLGSQPTAQLFAESLLRSLGPVIIIWLLGFARLAGLLAFAVVTVQGLSYGFATTIVMITFGFDDGIFVAMLYTPQALLILPALAQVCANSAAHALGRNYHAASTFSAYVRSLAIPVCASLASALLDVFLTPHIAMWLF